MRLIAAGSACKFQVRLSRTTTSIHRNEREEKENWETIGIEGERGLQKDPDN